MKKLLVIALVLFTTNALAQSDSLRNAILQYRDTTLLLVTNGRQMLREKLLNGRYEEVRDLSLYLLDYSDEENVVVFNFPEYIFLLYWAQDYHKLFPEVRKQPASDLVMGPSKEVVVKPDNRLLEILAEKTRMSLPFLNSLIDQSGYTMMERDFLKLNLKSMLRAFFNSPEITDSLNVLSNEFLQKYPQSEYIDFVKKNIRQEYERADWSWGVNLYTGYGFINKGLKKDFTNNIPLGLSFDVGFKNLQLYLRLQAGFAFTQHDITYDYGVWKKGAQVRAYMAETTLGYKVFENKTLSLSPFVGFSGMEISPTDHDLEKTPELKQATLRFTGNYAAGLNANIKLSVSLDRMYFHDQENTVYLQLRYAYHAANFEKKYGIDGNMHTITIGIGGMTRRVKRAY